MSHQKGGAVYGPASMSVRSIQKPVMGGQEGDGVWDELKDFVSSRFPLPSAKEAAKSLAYNALTGNLPVPTLPGLAAWAGNRIATAAAKGPRTAASTRFKSFLDANAGKKVVSVQLGRKPIVPVIHKALDAISFGAFSRRQKQLNYDKVYHNYLLVTLDDGKTYKMEKNETILHTPAKASDFKNQMWDIPLKGKALNLKDMVATASAGNESRFYKYRANSDNCQRFTRDMIEKNGLLPEDNSDAMSVQDAKSLVSAVPFGETVTNAITDAASVADRAIHGDGAKLKQALLQRYL
jgi:hypothetical protein